MKIFAIVVTYKGIQWYDRCLGSLRDSQVPITTIVVDNASEDGSVEYIKEHFPDVVIMPQNENLGFAKANNIGIRYALDHGADYVFLLNQDAWVNEIDSIAKMLTVFKELPSTGIVCPVNVNGSNTGMDEEYATDMPSSFISDMYYGKLKEYYETKYINAAAWLVSSDCIRRVGGFDTNMFVHYGEDNNYCQRVVFHGFKIVIYTRTTICHDKAFRLGKEKEYRDRSFIQRDLSDRIMWNNILIPIDVSCQIGSLKRSRRWMTITGRLWRLKELHKRILFFEKVKVSREANTKGGMVWL